MKTATGKRDRAVSNASIRRNADRRDSVGYVPTNQETKRAEHLERILEVFVSLAIEADRPSSVSVHQILDSSGLSKSSFYYAIGQKPNVMYAGLCGKLMTHLQEEAFRKLHEGMKNRFDTDESEITLVEGLALGLGHVYATLDQTRWMQVLRPSRSHIPPLLSKGPGTIPDAIRDHVAATFLMFGALNLERIYAFARKTTHHSIVDVFGQGLPLSQIDLNATANEAASEMIDGEPQMSANRKNLGLVLYMHPVFEAGGKFAEPSTWGSRTTLPTRAIDYLTSGRA